jgi:hypothetical protein
LFRNHGRTVSQRDTTFRSGSDFSPLSEFLFQKFHFTCRFETFLAENVKKSLPSKSGLASQSNNSLRIESM